VLALCVTAAPALAYTNVSLVLDLSGGAGGGGSFSNVCAIGQSGSIAYSSGGTFENYAGFLNPATVVVLAHTGFRVTAADPIGPDVDLDIAALAGRSYYVLARDNSIDVTPYTLFTTSALGDFSFTDTGVVGHVDRRFYQVVESNASVVATNPAVWAAYVKFMNVSAWYKLSMPIDLGSSNTLDSLLGEQLERGLHGHNDDDVADLLYVMNTNGGFVKCYLDGGEAWKTNGAAIDHEIGPCQSFWIKRRSGGANSNAVYTGKVYTNAEPVVFRSNAWHMIAWPFPRPRREDAGASKGWGFSAAGAHEGNSWMNSDRLQAGAGTSMEFLYLKTDGRWYRPGELLPASNAMLHAGEGYYYYHGGTGFTWTAQGE